jgi:hypothetical protein
VIVDVLARIWDALKSPCLGWVERTCCTLSCTILENVYEFPKWKCDPQKIGNGDIYIYIYIYSMLF